MAMIHINVKLEARLVEALDRFRVTEHLENRSQALRRILWLALLADEEAGDEPVVETPVVERNTRTIRRKAGRAKVVGKVEPVVPSAAEQRKRAQQIVDNVVGSKAKARVGVNKDQIEGGW